MQLLLFLDRDSEKVCLMYSIYGMDERGWSQPSPVDPNTAGDDTPQVEDLGGELLITWSSQGKVSTDDPASKLNSRDIKAVFFNKAARTFSDVQYVTKTTEADNTADDYACASYYTGADGAKKLMVTYIKTQYEQTGDELAVGDLTDAYSTIAYRFYDFATGQWADAYSDQTVRALLDAMPEEDAAAFTENWYGQGFVDLSRYVTVGESDLAIQEDDPALGAYAGLWSREPASSEISLASLTSDPKVVEHETTNCGKYAVSAYLIDLDGSGGTIDDRDIFLQLYDFESEKFYPAMRLTNDARSQGCLELADTPEGVKLYCISNGNIAQWDISRIVDSMLETTAGDGTEVLVLNKHYQEYSGEQIVLAAPEDEPYTEFVVNSDGSNVYLTWTESGVSFKEGIDPNSDEATKPENYYSERQMYMAMETFEPFEYPYLDENGVPDTYPSADDSGNPIDWSVTPDINGETGRVKAGDPIVETMYEGRWTQPVQMTDEQGANLSDIDCVMIGGGLLRCVYLKGMSEIIEISGERIPAENPDNRLLIGADFDFNVERYTVSIDNGAEVTAGREDMPIEVTVKNESLLTMTDVHLALTAEKDGKAEFIDDVVLEELGGGESVTATLLWDTPAGLDGVSLVAAVDQGGLDYGSATETLQNDSLIEITDVSHKMLDRNTAQFTVSVVNSGSENARAERVYLSCGGTEVESEEFDLVSGGAATVTIDARIPEEAFEESRTETAITETAPVKLYTTGSIVDDPIERTADIALEALLDGAVKLVDRDGNSYTDSIQLTVGELLMLESDGADRANHPRMRISSGNEAVVSITNGVLTAKRTGTAKIKVELYPGADIYTTNESQYMQAVDAYNTLPSCLIQTRELTVRVGGGSEGSSGLPPRIADTKNGSVEVNPQNPETGDSVTVTVTPDKGYTIEEIRVTDENGKQIEVTDNGDGVYSFIQPGSRVTVAVLFICDGKTPNCPSTAFTDLNTSAWYHTAADFVLDSGLMNGYGNGKFGPGNVLTRAQFAQILYNRDGGAAAKKSGGFTDVASDAWYYDAVAWGVESGVAEGYGNGKFGPDDPVTREQLAAMLWRYAGRPRTEGTLDGFTDSGKVSGYAWEALRWAVEQKIIQGKGKGSLDPAGRATRAEAAAMLMRYYQLQK